MLYVRFLTNFIKCKAKKTNFLSFIYHFNNIFNSFINLYYFSTFLLGRPHNKLFLKSLRAITSGCVNLCKIEKGSLFTYFGSKNTHISWGKIVQLCIIATVTVHICTATVAFAYHILVFFFSFTLSSSLYPLWLSPLSFSLISFL